MDSRTFINKYLYFGLIVVLSIFMLFFLPMLGSEAGLEWALPDTTVGWVIWIVSNLCSAFLNGLLFHFFVKQGKLNIKDDKNYQEALAILAENEDPDSEIPVSPARWHASVYGKKGVSLVLFSIVGAISFSSAVLVFNLVKFLAQLFTLLMGLVFGFASMKTEEEYWTTTFLKYAKYRQKQNAQIKKETENNVCSQ